MTPIGYAYLNQYYQLLLPKLNLEVYQDPSAETESIQRYGASQRKILPRHIKTPTSPYEHMIAAIKHQGIRLPFFAAIFRRLDVEAFTLFIAAAPNAKHNRVLWHLYEWLIDTQLALPDLKFGNYVALFDDRYYFTLAEGDRDRRTRVRNNAIGTREYCPTVRKTPEINKLAKTDVYKTAYAEIQKLGEHLSADVIGRSVNYLYTKETRSSNAIENERPDDRRTQRFLNAIKNAGLFELSKEKLIDIQNQIVAETAKAGDYRDFEIYVGSVIHRRGEMDEDVHYVGCPARHVHSMMRGFFALHDRLMLDGGIPSLIHAAIVSFAEVYIHPFTDGNGRIHRYLIHDVMRQREHDHRFVIPISAAILRNTSKYDEVLESISVPLLAMLDYHFDNDRRLVIDNDIDYVYRYPDFTRHVCFVYEMMNTAISEELVQEIVLLQVFDTIKEVINRLVDVPNHKLDTLVSIVISGGGKVSRSKHRLFGAHLDDSQIADIESLATALIERMKSQFSVDLQAVMNTRT